MHDSTLRVRDHKMRHFSLTINHKPGHNKSDVNQMYSTGGEKVINSTPAMHSRVVWTNYLVNRGETILDYTLINCTNKLIKASRAVNAMLPIRTHVLTTVIHV